MRSGLKVDGVTFLQAVLPVRPGDPAESSKYVRQLHAQPGGHHRDRAEAGGRLLCAPPAMRLLSGWLWSLMQLVKRVNVSGSPDAYCIRWRLPLLGIRAVSAAAADVVINHEFGRRAAVTAVSRCCSTGDHLLLPGLRAVPAAAAALGESRLGVEGAADLLHQAHPRPGQGEHPCSGQLDGEIMTEPGTAGSLHKLAWDVS